LQVFDLHQGSDVTYLESLLLRGIAGGLSQLTSEISIASVLDDSSFIRVPPLDLMTNSLVSPFFFGIQSTSVSDREGRVVLSGVRVRQNLPGAWKLQCGADGVMMQSPVRTRFHRKNLFSRVSLTPDASRLF
jgi:hypothetical protein